METRSGVSSFPHHSRLRLLLLNSSITVHEVASPPTKVMRVSQHHFYISTISSNAKYSPFFKLQ
ncbi:hypothetical protein A2U01_0025207 [Trifolium medium]|uniref:Uncharacterized protein n=1 Tax=Trifolium medium TaxID=97028 RepID=A0A392NWG5_9FABA|nr:hypothetical protein [Trifolium medium]